MSNNYTQFSFILILPSQEAIDYALTIYEKIQHLLVGDDPGPEEPIIPPNLSKELADSAYFDCVHQTHPDGLHMLWFSHGDESGDPFAAALFVSHLLEKFDPEACCSFTWADWCDKPRVDEFSGGGVFITAESVDVFSPGQACEAKIDAWHIAQEAKKIKP